MAAIDGVGSVGNYAMKEVATQPISMIYFSFKNIYFNSFILAAPKAPRNLKFSELSRTTIHLTWNIPQDDGGLAISNYTIERLDRDTWLLNSSITNSYPFIFSNCIKSKLIVHKFSVTGLEMNTRYSFRIAAINTYGSSDYSSVKITTASRNCFLFN